MSIADTFKQFLCNIAVDNGETISLRYGEVTAALNKKFRDTESKVSNSLQVARMAAGQRLRAFPTLICFTLCPPVNGMITRTADNLVFSMIQEM